MPSYKVTVRVFEVMTVHAENEEEACEVVHDALVGEDYSIEDVEEDDG